MSARVSIITVNFNQTLFTLQLLESLRKSQFKDIEVIVVDNGSKENPEASIKATFPEVKVILSKTNLGFAGGNNLGINAAEGRYLFFVNNDTEVSTECIGTMVDFFETTPDAGIASPKILYHNSDSIIQYVGCGAVNPFTGRNHREGFREKDTGQFDHTRSTDLAHGAAMMVPRRVIEKIGAMPEVFFLYYEELDWCESIKRAGYKVYVVPHARVYHKESMSIGKDSPLKTYYMTRNRLLFMRRTTGGITKLSWILFFVLLSIPKNSLKYLFKNQLAHLKAFWKGFLWNVSHRKDGSRFNLLSAEQ